MPLTVTSYSSVLLTASDRERGSPPRIAGIPDTVDCTHNKQADLDAKIRPPHKADERGIWALTVQKASSHWPS